MEGPKDDLKWFGEGFDGFPKHLPEDCMEYMLFIIDSRLNFQKEILQRLETVRKAALKFKGDLLKDYIWQRDSFSLDLKIDSGSTYLHGLTNYGDSVEDEWLIVYLLRDLSRQFPELWIKVVDTDGEFLLIEAANALPRWLNPEIADNRVWINNNSLKIIPLAAADTTDNGRTAPISRSLSLPEAQNIIAEKANTLINSPLLEAEAFYRLRNYPAQISKSLHHAVVTIPRKLAHVLHECPSSIAHATEVFYLRDPIALKPLQSISTNLTFPPVDLVSMSVRFTKVLYAQLKSQQFSAPVVWKSLLQKAEKDFGTDHKMFAKLEMGMKVTSGFEMMMIDPANRNNRSYREVQILLEDLNENEAGDRTRLPNNEEISSWPESNTEDEESWLDINFEEFEKELQGKNKSQKPNIPGAFGPDEASGFGDAKTQGDLRKMVERFEAFLNDDNAGPDGAELDDMDFDDDEEDSENDSEDEDKEVSFDEAEFAKMMREMMGMPPDESAEAQESKKQKTRQPVRKIQELDSHEEDPENETAEIMKLMRGMEAELKEAGALDLDMNLDDALQGKLKGKLKGKEEDSTKNPLKGKHSWESDSDSNEDLNIDFNLAKNLLESFKSQGGMAGPGGNLMGMMGMTLPRDEDDADSGGTSGSK